MGSQADEQSETAKREDIACTCSSMHIQGRLTHKYSHRCRLHNDTMEHDCTSKNIVPGLIVTSDGQTNFIRFDEVPETINTPHPVEDACICSTLHIQGKAIQKYYNRCPVHNDTEEHTDYTRNIVIGQGQ